ncbi:MAG: DUF4302 domain-containing protein [Sphingobacterium sp.]|jgi:hypothetical protein|nr:DUF4302 domain-containing protein [Sphingobacterium sp.]
MKQIYILLALIPLLFSCQKEDMYTGLRPDERLSEAMQKYENLLKDAPYGWKGHLYTQEGGGYGFLFNFDGKNRVQMLADISDESTHSSKESSYRLKAALLPSLYFDTYSYIHLLADPDPNVFGGKPAWGYYSDFEFSILKNSTDSIWMRGNLNGSKLLLVKASQEESNAYKAGNLQALKTGTIDFLNTNRFPYIMTKAGDLVALNFNMRTKKLTLTYDSAQQVQNKSVGFAFSGLNYLELESPIRYGGTQINRFSLDKASSFLVGLDGAKETPLFSSSTPLFSFNQMLGVQFDYILIPFEENVPGSGSDFNARRTAALNQMRTMLTAGSKFPYLAVRFDKKEKTMLLTLVIQQGNESFVANYSFYYTMENEKYKFFYEKAVDGNATYIFEAMIPVLQGFVNGDFSFDYQVVDNELMGYGQSSSNPNFKFLGTLE